MYSRSSAPGVVGYSAEKVCSGGAAGTVSRRRRRATDTIEDESRPPLKSAATGSGARIRQRTASEKVSRNASSYSASVARLQARSGCSDQ